MTPAAPVQEKTLCGGQRRARQRIDDRAWCIDSFLPLHHDAHVRTTVTLDADTERLLRSAMRERNLSFKAALNDAIRRGLRPVAAESEQRFRVGAKPMHLRSGIDPSRMHDLDAALEVEAFRALTARLQGDRTP